MATLPLVTVLTGALLSLFFLWFFWVSRVEEESRAASIALAAAVLLPIPYLLAGLIPWAGQNVLCFGLLGLTIGMPAILLLPIGNRFPAENETPNAQIDERDIMFSRKSLTPGSERFEEYYERFPERRAMDDAFRRKPGLLQKGAKLYDPISAAAADASFDAVAAFHGMLDAEVVAPDRHEADPEEMSVFLKEWIRKMGAVSVGITELKPHHLYSTIGRGERYGEPNDLDHRYAIALTVEMDKYFVDRAPKGPTVMESARQYLNSGAMAVVVAEFIRKLGFPSRAHIDGSYRVVCPVVARDAGLGEIGRMGLLMTPELGPRVRIAVITTDLPLVADPRNRDDTMIDFCLRCKKCADVCPSNSISFDDREVIDGVLQWKIDSDSCFGFWSAIGTDCARCMGTCPYSHPDNALHNLVRFGIKRSGPAREVALRLDDLFYGRKPAPVENPEWLEGVV